MLFSSHLIAAVALLGVQSVRSLQPNVLTIESYPSRRVFGSMSQPLGSPWCDGKPTYWLVSNRSNPTRPSKPNRTTLLLQVGHQGDDETPYCLVPPAESANLTDYANYNYTNATFERPRRAVLDSNDDLNDLDGPNKIDRHTCAALDINADGTTDIVCGVGANRGTGHGFTEVYLTTESSGNITKVQDGHGLHKHTTIRSRWLKPLTGADGSQLLFVAARGAKRADNATNTHRMYRIIPDPAKTVSNHSFFFREVQFYSWRRNTKASCLLTQDLNNDGLDDVLMCNEGRRSLIFLQNQDSTWTTVPTTGDQSKDWSNARVADITGDGISDLIVVGRGAEGYVRIFEGKPTFPHFDFLQRPFFERRLPYSSPDVELVDANNDGILDMYVVQVNQTVSSDNYCSHASSTVDFYGQTGPKAPDDFTPPLDRAKDLLLLGNSDGTFDDVWMEHEEPGCGYMVEQFGSNHTLLLAQGSDGKSGHNLLLQW